MRRITPKKKQTKTQHKLKKDRQKHEKKQKKNRRKDQTNICKKTIHKLKTDQHVNVLVVCIGHCRIFCPK